MLRDYLGIGIGTTKLLRFENIYVAINIAIAFFHLLDHDTLSASVFSTSILCGILDADPEPDLNSADLPSLSTSRNCLMIK